MAVRVLHCAKSVQNYALCIQHKVGGFSSRGPKEGDLVYLAVKYNKIAWCGARFTLGRETDQKPWPDAERYVLSRKALKLEFCIPFDISVLSEVGGKWWGPKYIQSSKAINDPSAVNLLNQVFLKNRVEEYWPLPEWIDHDFEIEQVRQAAERVSLHGDGLFQEFDMGDAYEIEEEDEEENITDEQERQELEKEVPENKINISTTYQMVPFINEQDPFRGLETLVNQSFFDLFKQFPEENSILIQENRLFKTQAVTRDGKRNKGISSIPDALLISFDEDSEAPIKINLIEYECYGEGKTTEGAKSRYLNTHIIPQLMRFASAFSLTTEEKTREKTISDWAKKIRRFINSDKQLVSKFLSWTRKLYPSAPDYELALEFEDSLKKAFHNSIKIILIIDELGSTQSTTIKNVVNSFKLDEENGVAFDAFVVRLIQKIEINDDIESYSLSIESK